MSAQDDPQADDKATTVAKFIRQYWGWFGLLLMGKRSVGSVALDGFSARFDGYRWLVIVRGLDVERMEYVCAFGSADRLYDSLKNVTSTINKAGWKGDKYRHFVAGLDRANVDQE